MHRISRMNYPSLLSFTRYDPNLPAHLIYRFHYSLLNVHYFIAPRVGVKARSPDYVITTNRSDRSDLYQTDL